jgi:hypothetical protein
MIGQVDTETDAVADEDAEGAFDRDSFLERFFLSAMGGLAGTGIERTGVSLAGAIFVDSFTDAAAMADLLFPFFTTAAMPMIEKRVTVPIKIHLGTDKFATP